MGSFAAARDHLTFAVEQAKLDLQVVVSGVSNSPSACQSAHKTLGDRLGNLAICLEKLSKEQEYQVIMKEGLRHDEEGCNLLGFMLKQYNLFDHYLANDDTESALNVLSNMHSELSDPLKLEMQ